MSSFPTQSEGPSSSDITANKFLDKITQILQPDRGCVELEPGDFVTLF